MHRNGFVLSLICVLFAACTAPNETPKSEATGESEPVAGPFEGSWTLVSWTRTSAGGETIYPYGEDAFGRIFYQANGKMAAILMRRGRPKVSAERLDDVTPEDRLTLGEGFFAYSGTYLVDHDQRTVTHRIEACTNPNWVGTERVRKFERAGEDRIVMWPVEIPLPTESIWQREK